MVCSTLVWECWWAVLGHVAQEHLGELSNPRDSAWKDVFVACLAVLPWASPWASFPRESQRTLSEEATLRRDLA